MVGVIVALHRTLARNRMTTGRSARVALGATVGFSLAGVTILLAVLDLPATARADLIAVVLGVWLVGWLVAASFTGGPELTGQHFRMHPISRTRLVTGLFAAAWTGLPAMVALVAFGVLLALAVPLGPAAVVVALLAAPLSVTVLILAARLAAIWFAAVSRSRLGGAISSIVTAAIIVVAQHSWLLVLAIWLSADTGLPGPLGTAVRALPSSWGLVAVQAAGDGAWALVAGGVLGLLALGGGLFAVWTRVVDVAPVRASVVRAPPKVRSGGPGVVRKELLAWVRQPLRIQDMVLAIAYAVGTCALPLILDFGALLPFLGVTVVIMGVATSSNMYGTDGTALWLTLAVPGSERGDVSGRQIAWLIVFGGLGVVLTAVGLVAHPSAMLAPWAIGGLLAVLGAGAGLVMLLSVRALVPSRDPHIAKHSPADQSDTTGSAFLAIFLTLALMSPTAGVLLAGELTGRGWLLWAGMGLGGLTAVVLPVLLGAAAARYLAARGPELLHRMRSGPVRPEEVRSEDAGSDESSAHASALEAMSAREAVAFWGLNILAILATIPQGLVAVGHLLAGSDVRNWFLALHMPDHLQWPVAVGFILGGLTLAATATSVFLRARRRTQPPSPADQDAGRR